MVQDIVHVRVFRFVKREVYEAVSFLHHVDHFCRKRPVSKRETRAHARPLAGAHECFPKSASALTQEQEFHRRLFSSGNAPEKARGDHFRVVDHKHVGGGKIVENIVKMTMLHFAVGAMQYHKARTVARLCGVLRDPLFGEIVRKIRGFKVSGDERIANNGFHKDPFGKILSREILRNR